MGLYVSLILLLLTTRSTLPSYANVHFIVFIWELTDIRINQPTWNLLLYMLGVNGQNRASLRLGDRHRVTPKTVCLVFLKLSSCTNDTGTTECASFHPGGVTCDDARFKNTYFSCSVYLEMALNCKSWSTVARAWPDSACCQQNFHWTQGWRVN